MEANAKKNEMLVGLFLLVGLALLGGLIIRFGALSDSFKETYPLTVTFKDASGITKGAPVKLGGATVGRVKEKPSLNQEFTGVVVSLDIFTGLSIPENSEFRVGSSGLMGDALIDVRPPKELTGNAIPAGTHIAGTTSGGLGDITRSAQEVADKTQVVLGDIQIGIHELTRAIDKVNEGLLSEENLDSFSTSLEHFGSSIARLDSKVLTDETTDDIRLTIANLKETSLNLKDGSTKIAPFFDKLHPLVDKLDPVVADLRRASSKLESTFDSIDTTAKDVSAAVNTITRGQGVVAALLNDGDLKANLRLFAANLKEHGILRYKDDAVLTREGTVLTSDGRPTTQPTYSKPQPASGPLKSRFPGGR